MTSAILISNQTNTKKLVEKLLSGFWTEFNWLKKTDTGIFSVQEIERFIEEEEIHDRKILTAATSQSLKSMSSGERKNALLGYLLEKAYDCLIVVNPFDNLDVEKIDDLKNKLVTTSKKIQLVQILTRSDDALHNTERFYAIEGEELKHFNSRGEFSQARTIDFNSAIPAPLAAIELGNHKLIEFKNVNVQFEGRQVLQNINWIVNKGEFWQLKGPNGSGKSTLLNMITGESHKGYGQDLTLFGHKKGSGESVWDIKEVLGYFTPAMVDRFRGYHSIENMLISGLHDSVGLYQKPTDTEKNLALKWLSILNMTDKKNFYFHQLSLGEKRLVMTARAMIKHPPLLILDEPTVGLDDESAHFFVNLVNKFAVESDSTIIYVSHRKEKGLTPRQYLELIPDPNGSKGKIHYI